MPVWIRQGAVLLPGLALPFRQAKIFAALDLIQCNRRKVLAQAEAELGGSFLERLDFSLIGVDRDDPFALADSRAGFFGLFLLHTFSIGLC